MSRLLRVLVACLIIVLLLAVAGCGGETEGVTDAAQDATGVDTGGGEDASSPAGDGDVDAGSAEWVKVFTLKGGGEGHDGRYSEEFELQGGEQRVEIRVERLEAELHFWKWYIDGDGDGAMVGKEQSPEEFEQGGDQRKDSFTYHLSAGTYYVMPNTVGCNWTLTIYERR